MIYSNLSLQLQYSANFITEQNIHKKTGKNQLTVNMEIRIYFKALSEILLKKKSDFMQFKVIFHWSKVKYLCSLTAENTMSFNYIMIQEKEKRIPPRIALCFNTLTAVKGMQGRTQFMYLGT